jgi:hypothetical protein
MQQNPSWEANRFSSCQEIPRILWNTKVHYLIHKCPPIVSILSQLDLIYAPTSHVLKIHLNILGLGLQVVSLTRRVPCQNSVYNSLPKIRHMNRPPPPSNDTIDFVLRHREVGRAKDLNSILSYFLSYIKKTLQYVKQAVNWVSWINPSSGVRITRNEWTPLYEEDA